VKSVEIFDSEKVLLDLYSEMLLSFTNMHVLMSSGRYIKEAQSRFVHIEKFSLNFSNSSFIIRVNPLHP